MADFWINLALLLASAGCLIYGLVALNRMENTLAEAKAYFAAGKAYYDLAKAKEGTGE